MDCGCRVDGYYADISRTLVFGEPDKRQRDVFRQVRQGNNWVDALVAPATGSELEDRVLARARELRSQSASR